MSKIVKLRQNRQLLGRNFDGYNHSSEPMTAVKKILPTPPFVAETNAHQSDSLHIELLSQQNLLNMDPWNRNHGYFINRDMEIIFITLRENQGRKDFIRGVVFCINSNEGGSDVDAETRESGDYNYSMRFISKKYCVLLDGIRTVFLFDTGDRLMQSQWKVVAKTKILIGVDAPARNFMLYDCRLEKKNKQLEILLALGRVHTVEAADGDSQHYFHVHCAKWTLNDTSPFHILETLSSEGLLYYCAFDPLAEAIVLGSNCQFEFLSKKPNVLEESTPQLHDEHAKVSDICKFKWSQTENNVMIKFGMKSDGEENVLNIMANETELIVNCNEETLFHATLFGEIDQARYRISGGFLFLTLTKHSSQTHWTSLMPNGAGPEETDTIDNDNMQETPVNASENQYKLERFDLKTKTITHVVMLGSTPPLFSTCLFPGYSNAVAIASGDDIGLWSQKCCRCKPDEWWLTHENNLHVFNKVLSAFQEKKFVDCSPGAEYSVVCAPSQYLYIYQCKHVHLSETRNSNGSRVSHFGEHHAIDLDDKTEIVGLLAAPNMITILSKSCILFIEVK